MSGTSFVHVETLKAGSRVFARDVLPLDYDWTTTAHNEAGMLLLK